MVEQDQVIRAIEVSAAPAEGERCCPLRKASWWRRYGGRAGGALFLFFLIKGLVWLVLLAGAVMFGWKVAS